MLSEGDHRLSRVEPWVKEPLRTLRRCIDSTVRPRDLADERLATILDYLCVAACWAVFERALNQSVWRVYDLQGRLGRLDTTTAAAYVTPAGRCQLGHSQDHRPDRSQGKIAMAVLDPLGVPLTLTVVVGNTADDPLYLPEIAPVRPIAPITGLTSVGDCKMAAIGTRTEIVVHQDDYLCLLSAKQKPDAELDRVLAPVFRGVPEPSEIRVPDADGALAETADPVALGCAYTVERRALDQTGQTHAWQERRLVGRSLALAASQEKSLRPRVARADRKQGKAHVPDAAGAYQAAAAIMATQRRAGLVHVTVTPDGHTHVKRRYGTRQATTVRSERGRVRATCAEAPLAHAVRRLGWRVYATNHAAEAMRLAQGVAASRSAYLVAPGCGRLTGRSLSLPPLFWQYEERSVGLRYLLSSARRGLVWMQCGVRRHLQQAGTRRTGIYPGPPGRQTAQPTTEMLLAAGRGVTLSWRKIDGTPHEPLPPLHAVQKRILALMEVPPERYGKLVT